jgi:hypothetical protein
MSVTDTEPVQAEPSAPYDDLDDESWLASSQPKGVRVRAPLAALVLCLAVALGIWGGATLQASQNSTATTAAAFTAGGGGRGGGGAANAAAGGAAPLRRCRARRSSSPRAPVPPSP